MQYQLNYQDCAVVYVSSCKIHEHRGFFAERHKFSTFEKSLNVATFECSFGTFEC